jgi:hypothetical protein
MVGDGHAALTPLVVGLLGGRALNFSCINKRRAAQGYGELSSSVVKCSAAQANSTSVFAGDSLNIL